ncbi:Protein of unknown function [Pyronema omphalodes CBS 100304]|uniref:Uncharacterized protein n=1 Tax=Pyronema omphalodes (strain CBS 100304) TaxID=1076935 RepID=U4LIK2_PYROM|nr:Protein of unknown function [Pyronema omphalodes CBS 100304]
MGGRPISPSATWFVRIRKRTARKFLSGFNGVETA